ncbi:MAG: IS1 family transposase [Clostridiaceae bacterium]
MIYFNRYEIEFRKMFLKPEDIFNEDDIENARRSAKPALPHKCPNCSSQNINRNGKTRQRKQRYICKSCGKSFSEMTGSPFMYSKKSIEMWIKYLFCMKESLTLREITRYLGICLTTSFHWRHKILSVVGTQIKGCELSQNIDVHEMKMKENFKGNHSKKPVFMDERGSVMILSSKDSEGNTLVKAPVKNEITREVLDKVLVPVIKNGRVLGSPRRQVYINFARDNNLILNMKGSCTYSVEGMNTGKAQAQSLSFKRFLYIFSGVASKYISYYIILFMITVESKENIALALLSKLTRGKQQLKVYEFDKVQFDGMKKVS